MPIPAIISGVSSIFGGLLGDAGVRQTNQTNIRLAREAREHDVKMWHMQNEYNTPEMQMQRLKEAGLNPNLMYGQGNTGNASSVQKAPVPEVQNSMAHIAQASLAPAISLYQDWRVKNAQIDNIQADTEAKRQMASLNALRGITQDFLNKRYRSEEPFFDSNAMMRNYLLQTEQQIGTFKAKEAQKRFYEALPKELLQIELRNNLLNQQIKNQRLENELNEQLKPFGVSSRDPLLHRIITLFLGNNKYVNPIMNQLFK